MLHHDNAPANASLLIREFLAKQETIVVPQPPYFPDLAPADFFLFPKLKSTLKGRRFQTVEEIKRKFATGPSRHPTEHVPELEKTLGAVYQQ
jgi:transposase